MEDSHNRRLGKADTHLDFVSEIFDIIYLQGNCRLYKLELHGSLHLGWGHQIRAVSQFLHPFPSLPPSTRSHSLSAGTPLPVNFNITWIVAVFINTFLHADWAFWTTISVALRDGTTSHTIRRICTYVNIMYMDQDNLTVGKNKLPLDKEDIHWDWTFDFDHKSSPEDNSRLC